MWVPPFVFRVRGEGGGEQSWMSVSMMEGSQNRLLVALVSRRIEPGGSVGTCMKYW